MASFSFSSGDATGTRHLISDETGCAGAAPTVSGQIGLRIHGTVPASVAVDGLNASNTFGFLTWRRADGRAADRDAVSKPRRPSGTRQQ